MSKRWFAVRSVFKFGEKKDGTNIFEERVVLFRAENEKEAFARAEDEAREYLDEDDDEEMHPHLELYKIDDDVDDLDGQEVWSFLTQSDLEIEDHFDERFDKAEYQIDEEE